MDVSTSMNYHRETFYLSVNFFDRYLGLVSDVKHNNVQLIGVTCLVIASKIEEEYGADIKEFAYLTGKE